MRPLAITSSVLLILATPVFAQVTVDLHALQALPEHPRSSLPPRRAPATASQPSSAPQAVSRTPNPANSGSTAPDIVRREQPNTTSAPGTTPAPAQPAMPESIPDTASIAPITPPAAAPGAPSPPPPPVAASAATAAAPTASGLRLTFAPEQSDLSPESSTSIKQLTQSAPPGDDTTFNVLAYAPGKADDPSTARRVSLSRAMAVRSALVADGVPSARIFVRALGAQYGSGPPDRVDLSVTSANAQTGAAIAR